MSSQKQGRGQADSSRSKSERKLAVREQFRLPASFNRAIIIQKTTSRFNEVLANWANKPEAVEGLPTVLLAAVLWLFLPGRPQEATWLTAEEKNALARLLQPELFLLLE